MFSILFWNLAKRDAVNYLDEACQEHDIDIAVLAEFGNHELRRFFNLRQRPSPYIEVQNRSIHIKVFTRLPLNKVRLVADVNRASFQLVNLPSGTDLLIAGVHLVSKADRNTYTQLISAQQIRADIERFELQSNVKKTIIIGDFNMNPVDPGMTTASAFHAMMDKVVVERGSRTIAGANHSFFYNPMWGYLGDRTEGPSGTYRFGGRDVDDIYWHSFDQVIMRPEVAGDFLECKVLTSINGTNLVTKRKLVESISDHLPIVARFNY